MNTKPSIRPGWVWATIALQFVILLIKALGVIQVFASWSHYAAYGIHMLPLAIRSLVYGGLAGVSLFGLWRTQRWGWALALLVDGGNCVQVLWTLLQYGALMFRSPTFLAFNTLEFAALVVLLHRPVMTHFLRLESDRGSTIPRTGVPVGGGSQANQVLRVFVYFAMAVIAACAAAAFTLAFLMGRRGEGRAIFVLALYSGLIIGSIASFLFALILTMVAHKLGPERLWVWLVLGGSLAPALTVVLGHLGNMFLSGPLLFVFRGPQELLQIWWLTPYTGIFTAWICYVMYPWGFSRLHQSRNPALR